MPHFMIAAPVRPFISGSANRIIRTVWIRFRSIATGKCHCGSLRVITTGELDRVYVYHCHFGASYPREQVRLDGERKIYERDADSGYRIRFHFCPNCGTTLYWEGDRNPAVCGVAVGAFDTSAFAPPSDSIWEESMHPWLGLPPRMDHHQQSRPRPHNSEEMTGAIQPARCLEFLN